MKKIALITDGWGRYVTYTWIQGSQISEVPVVY